MTRMMKSVQDNHVKYFEIITLRLKFAISKYKPTYSR